MSTKAQRRMKRVAAKHGKQFALERSVLSAARALMGAVRNHGWNWLPETTCERFEKAELALHEFHAERQRRKNRVSSTNVRIK